jgi:tetratricopeptide (TPR) repeat protein
MRRSTAPAYLIENIQSVERLLRKSREEGARHGATLLERPPSAWRAAMRGDPHLRSYGALDFLLEQARAMFEVQPSVAREITAAVLDFVEQVTDAPCASYQTSLRGKAWKEHANALQAAGDVGQALGAAKRAIEIYGESPGLHFQETCARLVLASVYRDLGNMDEALSIARECAALLLDYGRPSALTMARMIEGCTLFKLQRFAEALQLFTDIVEQAEQDGDTLTLARGLSNAAECARELGDLPAARDLYPRALAHYARIDAPTEANRTRWGYALSLAAEGRPSSAILELYAVRTAYLRIGANADAACAMLDIVRIRFDAGADVRDLCAELVTTLSAAGLTQNALEALAYLREQAVSGRVTTTKITRVRTFLNESTRTPALLFARPRDEEEG